MGTQKEAPNLACGFLKKEVLKLSFNCQVGFNQLNEGGGAGGTTYMKTSRD